MIPSPDNSNEATKSAWSSASVSNEGEQSVALRVREIAECNEQLDDLLRSLAAEMQRHFGTALVAVRADCWASPVMLVADQRTADQIDRDGVRSLLETAQPTPVACSVPVGDGA
ncbi:MAG: hypothetical protein AAF989_12050, partial [Planctomycetota bacterium]